MVEYLQRKGGRHTERFEEMYRENFARVYAFLLKLTKNPSAAEELTQETFYQAYVSMHRFRGDADVFTWLASIAKHVYFKYMKKLNMSAEESYVGLLRGAWTDGGEGDPEKALDRRELANSVRRAVASIPEKHRNVVILRAYADMSFAQIGRALGITENSAKVIYFRAKKKMMEELKNEYGM